MSILMFESNERKLEHTLEMAVSQTLVIIYQHINIKFLFASNTFKVICEMVEINGKDSYYTIPPYIKWPDRKT